MTEPKQPSWQSALYKGKVIHVRHVPIKHRFIYNLYLFWLNLDELEQLQEKINGFRTHSWAPVRFKSSDYLGSQGKPLKERALSLMSELAGETLQGKVFFLGQPRMWGIYFSPVNFYYLQQEDGHFSHMLAEVSNTPWNERHCYLVDLNAQVDSQKMFHVSPFNPMDMQYEWRVEQPDKKLKLHLSCVKDERHFEAGLQLNKHILNSKSLFNVLLLTPSMTLKTIAGIYWQALKLYCKGAPVYMHPNQHSQEKE